MEIQNINEFINTSNNPHRIVNPNDVSASIRRDDNDRPLRRPTTPMTNLSSTSNSQIFNQGRSIASKIRSNIKGINLRIDLNGEENTNENEINVNNNEYHLEKNTKEDQDNLGSTKQAFEKKDRLVRTPTKNSYEI